MSPISPISPISPENSNFNHIMNFSLQNNNDSSSSSDFEGNEKEKEIQEFQAEQKGKMFHQMYNLNSVNYHSLVLFLHTQRGCRIYQNQIQNHPSYANRVLFPSLKPYMLELINAKYGIYLYSTFVDVLNKKNFKILVSFISNNFEKISYSSRGKKIIQKLLQKVSFEKGEGIEIFIKFSQQIKGKVLKMSIHKNASSIIIKYIMLFSPEKIGFIYEEVFASFLVVANTKFGCVVIQKCLGSGNSIQKKRLIKLIIDSTYYLISNEFGNYVYQSLIVNVDDWVIHKVYAILSLNIFGFCKNKYSSNVIQKFFEIENKNLINEIAKSIVNFESDFVDLICNEFGSVIVQKMIRSITDEWLKKKIFEIVFKNRKKIKMFPYGVSFFESFLENI